MNYIYKICHKYIKKCYIGQTNNPCRRKREHFDLLRRGNHHNHYLQYTFKKWSKGWKFEIIDFMESPIECNLAEISYIHRYNGYNHCKGNIWSKYSQKGTNNSRYKHSITNKMIKDLREQGYSIPIIAQKLDTGTTMIHQRLKQIYPNGIPKAKIYNPNPSIGHRRIYLDLEDIIEQIKQGYKLIDAAHNLGVSRTTIPSILKRDYNTTWKKLKKEVLIKC